MNKHKVVKKVVKAVGLTVNVSDHVKTGVYSNIVNVTITSNQEVMLDFIYNHPNDKDKDGNNTGQVVSRVILPLSVAKSMKLVMDSQLGSPKKE